MRVPDEIHECVAFLGRAIRNPQGLKQTKEARTTAFFVGVPSEKFRDTHYIYLVTAQHSAKQLSLGGSWFGLCNIPPEAGYVEFAAGSETSWWYHPTEPERVDAAVIEMPGQYPPAKGDTPFRYIPVSMFATSEKIKQHNIGAGDLTFLGGLFSKAPDHYYQPVALVRTGNIAMIPPNRVPITIEKNSPVESEVYLVEVRSFGGISGSPVFVRETISFEINSLDRGKLILQTPGSFFLLGVMHGHWDIKKECLNEARLDVPRKDELAMNLGIAIVVPAKKILEILNQPGLIDADANWTRNELTKKAERRQID